MASFDATVGRMLRTSTRLLSRANAHPGRQATVADRLGGQLGLDIADFTSESLTRADAARLLTAGPLYVAAQLEACGLLEAVDKMAGVFATGGLPISNGHATQAFAALWQHRHQRFSHDERTAILGRLFGSLGGPALAGQHGVAAHTDNDDFIPLVVDLVHVLTSEQAGDAASAASLRQAVSNLAVNLAPRLESIPDMAEEDLLDAVKVGLLIFRDPKVQRLVGAVDARSAVIAAVARYVGRRSSIDSALACASTGQVLLSWVATSSVAPPGVLLTAPQAVLEAASAWARATLELVDAESQRT